MVIYHGGKCIVTNPDLAHSRPDIDFGVGFYTTEDNMMASKWAAGKKSEKAYLNTYELNLKGLAVVELTLSKQWLSFVVGNRTNGISPFDVSGVDIIIGPTADDKMFNTIREYMDDIITEEQAIRYLNVAGFSNQIVLKTEKALNRLSFIRAKELSDAERRELKHLSAVDRQKTGTVFREMKAKDRKNEHYWHNEPKERLYSEENHYDTYEK